MSVPALASDARAAARAVRRAPRHTLALVILVAAGIAGPTTIGTFAAGVLWAPFGIADTERVVYLTDPHVRAVHAVSPPDFADIRREARSLAKVATHVWSAANLSGGVTPSRLAIADVTGEWFDVFGVQMQAGRGIAPADEGAGGARVVVLSDRLWRTHFGSRPDIVGRVIALDGLQHEVVGVAPREFAYPATADLWRPMALPPEPLACRRCPIFWGPVARLHDAVSHARARVEIAQIAHLLDAQHGVQGRPRTFGLVPIRQHIIGGLRPVALAFAGAGVALLVASCVSIAGVSAMHRSIRGGADRVQLALGAPPHRLVCRAVLESLLIAAPAAVAGYALAAAGVPAMERLGPDQLGALMISGIYVPALATTVVATLAAVIGASVIPVVALARHAPLPPAMLPSGTSASTTATRYRLLIVAAQVAVAVPTVVVAAALSEQVARLVREDAGIDASGVLRLDLALPVCGTTWARDTSCASLAVGRYASPDGIRVFADEVLANVGAISGATEVAIAVGVPFTRWASNQTLVQFGEGVASSARRSEIADVKYVTAQYFAVLRIPLRMGRVFVAADDERAPRVAVVNEAFARAYLPSADPIASRIRHQGQWWTVVGVVANTKGTHLGDASAPALYVPIAQSPSSWMTVLIRAQGSPAALLMPARTAIGRVDANVPIFNAMPMEAAVAQSYRIPLVAATASTLIAVAALVLAAIGLAATTALAVHGRSRELAIRLALGCSRARMVWSALAEGMCFWIAGTAVGTALTIVVVRAVPYTADAAPAVTLSTMLVSSAIVLAVATGSMMVPIRRLNRLAVLTALKAD